MRPGCWRWSGTLTLIVMQCYAPMLVRCESGRPAMAARPDRLHCDQRLWQSKVITSFRCSMTIVAMRWFIPRWRSWIRNRPLTLDNSVHQDTKNGTLYIKVVNVTGIPQTLQVDVDGVKRVAKKGSSVVLTSDKLRDSNSILDPDKVVPVTEPADGLGSQFTRTFAPYSVNVLKVHTE